MLDYAIKFSYCTKFEYYYKPQNGTSVIINSERISQGRRRHKKIKINKTLFVITIIRHWVTTSFLAKWLAK